MCVAVGGHDLEYAVANLEDGYVERAAAEVVNCDGFVGLLFEAVGEGRGGGFVDDAEHFEAGDASGVFCGVALAVVEVGGDGDDGLGDGFAELGFGVLLHLLEDHGGHFGGRVVLSGDLDVGVAVGVSDELVGYEVDVLSDAGVVVAASHEALDGEDGVFGVCDGLSLGGGSDVAFAGAWVYGDHGGRCASAFGVFYDAGFAALDDGHARVGGAEVYSEYIGHLLSLLVVSLGFCIFLGGYGLRDADLGGAKDAVLEFVSVSDDADDGSFVNFVGRLEEDGFVFVHVEGLACGGLDSGEALGLHDIFDAAPGESQALGPAFGGGVFGYVVERSVEVVGDAYELEKELGVGALAGLVEFAGGALLVVFEVGLVAEGEGFELVALALGFVESLLQIGGGGLVGFLGYLVCHILDIGLSVFGH